MAHNNTVLGNMLQLLPRHVFEHQVETHAWQGPQPRKLSYWSQLVAMLYAQLSGKKSLRDLVFSLGRHPRKLYHLGLTPAKRSTLAEANEKRPARIFQKTYEQLLTRFQAEASRQPGARRVKILDATYVPVCASLFPGPISSPAKTPSNSTSSWTRWVRPRTCGLRPARSMNWRWLGACNSPGAIWCCWTGVM